MSRLGAPSRILCAAFAVLAASGCGHKEKAPAAAPYVASTVAVYGAVTPSQHLAGIVAPYQNVAIQSSLTEPADAVYVQEGDSVHVGQVLARLDTSDLEAQLQSDLATANSNQANTQHTVYSGSLAISQGVDTVRNDQAEVQQAAQTLTNDRQNLMRDQNLLAQGYVSQQAVDSQETLVRNDQQALNSANASLSAAKANVQANGSLSGGGMQASAVAQSAAQEKVALAQADQVRVQIAKATITSPLNGVVVNRNLNPGEYPGNREIFTLQQVDPIYAILHASSAQVAQIPTGSLATISVEDVGGAERYAGRVAGVLNQINPGSTDFQVKVLLQNPGRKLRPGMVAQGNITVPPIHGVRVPATAFTDDNHDALMTVASDGSVKTVKVAEIGGDGTTSVVSGIASGTRVISDGQASVGDGEKVSLRP